MTLEAPGNRRLDARGRPRAALVAALAAAIFCGAPAAWSQNRASRGEKPKARAKPPVAWDKTTASAFFPDAFATLEGERPDFTALETGAAEASSPAAAPAAPTAGGFKWSALISADTLADEIKDMRGGAAKAVASLSDFKGGGFNDARQAFSSIALCFAVIDGYDGDARFKRDAKTARDLFARAGNNCKVGTQQSFNEAKARVADLETMLQGNSLEAQPGGGPGPAWSDVAARAALMGRLETADEAANAAVASKQEFDKQVARLLHEVEVVAMIGEAIQRPDHEYHDDDTYRGYAAEMRDAAVKARAAAQRSDYDAARAAVGELKKSCDTCHGAYRS